METHVYALFSALEQMVHWHSKRGGPNDYLLPPEEQEVEIAIAMHVMALALYEEERGRWNR